MVARSTGREQNRTGHTPQAYAPAAIAYTTPRDVIQEAARTVHQAYLEDL
ncbi:hypothetical protein ACWEQL_04650 [Kitasatospora sp. NPDC004240]